MFDLMGAIRQRQKTRPPPADVAETAEIAQPRAGEFGEGLRKTAHVSGEEISRTTIYNHPHGSKNSKPLKTNDSGNFSANPPNPQTSTDKLQHNPDAMLLEIAQAMQADADVLRALLSDDDMQAVAEGEYSRELLFAYFRQMVRDGKSLTAPQGRLEPRIRQSIETHLTEPGEEAAREQTWRASHESFMNHLMVCQACYAPRNRYCLEGAKRRGKYLLACELAEQTNHTIVE